MTGVSRSARESCAASENVFCEAFEAASCADEFADIPEEAPAGSPCREAP